MRKQYLPSLAVAGVACLVYLLKDWHSTVNSQPVFYTHENIQSLLLQKQKHRNLQSSQEEPIIDDDFTRDETCRQYMVNFLNGTTDAKDECQGFYNAWKAADCQDEENIFPKMDDDTSLFPYAQDDDFPFVGRRHKLDNGTVVDDDVVIDDYYENWECCSSIAEFYERHCQQNDDMNAFKLLGVVLVLVVCGLVKSFLKIIPSLQWVPDAGACIVVGSVVGFVLRLSFTPDAVSSRITFDNDLFLHILLPPIIFEAAVSIDKRAFRRDLFPILTFAVIGTGLSAIAIGYITYHMSSWGKGIGLPLLDSLLFGALMSSIDPVATLSILSSVGVSQGDTLYTLIFGESLLNDGVAIVLFDSLVVHMGDADDIDAATVSDTLQNFVIVITMSILIGSLCGAACTFYFWTLQGKHTAVTEVALFFAWALVPYYIADGLKYSGIISIMVMGFVLDYYVIGGFQSDEGEWMEYMEMQCRDEDGSNTPPVEPCFDRIRVACSKAFSGRGHISSRSRHHVGFVAEVIANVMETAIFAYLGLFLFNDHSWNFKLMSSGLFSCVSSRAAMVIGLSLLVNICVWMDLEGKLGRCFNMIRQSSNNNNNSLDDDSIWSDTKVYLDRKTQLILFSAGVRGAVSYALVQNIPVYDSVTKHGSNFKGELRAMTSATIVVLLFAFGALTYFTVERDMSSSSPVRGGDRVAGPLTHRLVRNSGLVSTDGLEDSSDMNSLSLEIEGRPNTMQGNHNTRTPGSSRRDPLLEPQSEPRRMRHSFDEPNNNNDQMDSLLSTSIDNSQLHTNNQQV